MSFVSRPLVLRLPCRLANFPSIQYSARKFISISVHTRTPATIYRVQQTPQSNLVVPHPERGGIPLDEVKITQNGLVKIGSSYKDLVFNGALFMPNTQGMQELTRDVFDAYLDEDEDSKPSLVRIAKGTSIPESLLLLQCHSQFALQCSHAHTLQELNQRLDEFYKTGATMLDAAEWYTKNSFVNSSPDGDSARWMSE